ncbi:MAG TPA: helix-turn-helix transcriptional regulator [Flavobacteriales bacterium]|nr:helix-turn-helix transcriptional regulator [Flavobacteriales bacterium]
MGAGDSYTKKIKAVRRLKQLTQQDMADRLGFHDVREYGRLENGEKRLTVDLMDDVARIYGMSLIELLGFDEDAVLHGKAGESGTLDHAELVRELRARIRHLEGEVEFLRKQLGRP